MRYRAVGYKALSYTFYQMSKKNSEVHNFQGLFFAVTPESPIFAAPLEGGMVR